MIYERVRCIIEIKFDREKKRRTHEKHSTSREFMIQVTSRQTMAHLFNLLLCLRAKWKDKRVGFIRQRRFIAMTDAYMCDRDTVDASCCPPN